MSLSEVLGGRHVSPAGVDIAVGSSDGAASCSSQAAAGTASRSVARALAPGALLKLVRLCGPTRAPKSDSPKGSQKE